MENRKELDPVLLRKHGYSLARRPEWEGHAFSYVPRGTWLMCATDRSPDLRDAPDTARAFARLAFPGLLPTQWRWKIIRSITVSATNQPDRCAFTVAGQWRNFTALPEHPLRYKGSRHAASPEISRPQRAPCFLSGIYRQAGVPFIFESKPGVKTVDPIKSAPLDQPLTRAGSASSR